MTLDAQISTHMSIWDKQHVDKISQKLSEKNRSYNSENMFIT